MSSSDRKNSIVKQYLDLTTEYIREYGSKTCVLMQVGSFYEIYGLKTPKSSIIGSIIEQVSSDCDLIIANKKQTISCKNQNTARWLKSVHLYDELSIEEGNIQSKCDFQVVMAGFGLPQLNKYAKKLQKLGYTCPVYDQDIQAPNSSRSLTQIISPGTYLDVDGSTLSNVVAALVITESSGGRDVFNLGYSAYDLISGELNTYEWYADETGKSCLDELEHTVSAAKPHELVLISKTQSLASSITKYLGLNSSHVHIVSLQDKTGLGQLGINSSKQIYQHRILTKTFSNAPIHQVEEMIHTHELAMQSLTVLADFLVTHNKATLDDVHFPQVGQRANLVRLGNHTLKQLNILGDSGNEDSKLSIFKHLNYCLTKGGIRYFQKRISYPIHDVAELKRRYDIIQQLVNQQPTIIGLRSLLKRSCDVRFHLRLLSRKTITPRRVGQLTIAVQTALSICNEYPFVLDVNLDEGLVRSVSSLKSEILNVLDIDRCLEYSNLVGDFSIDRSGKQLDPSGLFRSGVNEELDGYTQSLSQNMESLESIRLCLENVIKNCEGKSQSRANINPSFLKLYKTPKSQFSIIGTTRRVTLLLDALKKTNASPDELILPNGDKFDINALVALSVSSKKDKCVTSPQIQSLVNTIEKQQLLIASIVRQEYFKFCSKLAEQIGIFELVDRIISAADLYQSCAQAAITLNLKRPHIEVTNKCSSVDVKALRHPLIEHFCTEEIYVPNDVSLSPENNGVLLYGTNAVGKSSLIKALGICVVLAQAGLFVPCSELVLNPYRGIFTRILGNDDIYRGLSTFAVEMSELRNILIECDENTLVLGDELCSGTESKSAHCIFAAGVEWLHNKNSSFIFATHFHEIAKFSQIKSLERLGFYHMKVSYDVENDELVYDRKLTKGMGDMMYGLEVCKALGLPRDFLARANDLRLVYSESSQLARKNTRYSSHKLKDVCELCGNPGVDIHHMVYQGEADVNGFIGTVHKNHPANLMNLCKECHDRTHKRDIKYTHRKTISGRTVVCADVEGVR